VRGWKPGAVSSELVTGSYELKVIAPALSPTSGGVRLGAIGRPLKRDTVCDVQVHDRRDGAGRVLHRLHRDDCGVGYT